MQHGWPAGANSNLSRSSGLGSQVLQLRELVPVAPASDSANGADPGPRTRGSASAAGGLAPHNNSGGGGSSGSSTMGGSAAMAGPTLPTLRIKVGPGGGSTARKPAWAEPPAGPDASTHPGSTFQSPTARKLSSHHWPGGVLAPLGGRAGGAAAMARRLLSPHGRRGRLAAAATVSAALLLLLARLVVQGTQQSEVEHAQRGHLELLGGGAAAAAGGAGGRGAPSAAGSNVEFTAPGLFIPWAQAFRLDLPTLSDELPLLQPAVVGGGGGGGAEGEGRPDRRPRPSLHEVSVPGIRPPNISPHPTRDPFPTSLQYCPHVTATSQCCH